MRKWSSFARTVVWAAGLGMVACSSPKETPQAQETPQAAVQDCFSRTEPFDADDAAESPTGDRPPTASPHSEGALSFAGFRIGDDSRQVEQTLRDRYGTFSVTRSECRSGMIQALRVGDFVRNGEPTCDIHGSSPLNCQAYLPVLRKAAPGAPATLFVMHYTAGFANGRPTSSVIADLESALGTALWRHQNGGPASPEIPQDTQMLWWINSKVLPEQVAGETFSSEVVEKLGLGQYAEARLLHRDNRDLVYGLTVSVYERLQEDLQQEH